VGVGVGAGAGAGAGDGVADPDAVARVTPHVPQKASPPRTAWPFEHAGVRATPQAGQKW